MLARPRLCVFSGPSLPVEDRLPIDNIAYLPPAARGDVEQASREFDAVLLIDGVFHHDLAPSPKECYAASQRAQCFGAASMGALRAAECMAYGFAPLGIIARWYASEIIEGDDEVAVLVDPSTQRALTIPSVNVRYVAWLARRRGLLKKVEADRLISESRGIYYMDRNWADVIALAPTNARTAIEQLAMQYGDLKRHDARFALRAVVRSFGRGEAVA